jgi:hypothetical protein
MLMKLTPVKRFLLERKNIQICFEKLNFLLMVTAQKYTICSTWSNEVVNEGNQIQDK